jgi:DNA topoisomerase-1
MQIEGLRYVSDSNAGITRKKYRNKFIYFDTNGNKIIDVQEINRIKSLAIPPAWTDVWICPIENGHIQATGRDAKRRKQYRYHKLWRESRDEDKFERMIAFGKALPTIRKKVNEALALPGLPREKVIATIIQLLQLTLIRVGNSEYARNNESFGLTTLRNRHVQINGSTIQFQFKGKSGITHVINVSEKKLAKIIKNIRDLPGQDLFQYVDNENARHTISSSDVNEYLRKITGENYTAKDFRTWFGTFHAAYELMTYEAFTSEAEAKRNIVEAIKVVAKKLGNTPTICRKSYIHPLVFSCYLSKTFPDSFSNNIRTSSINVAGSNEDLRATMTCTLSSEEAVILDLLETSIAVM